MSSPVPDFSPIDFRAELNDEQYAAVTAAEGPALVLAGAGSGKTRTLTYRVAWLLCQGIQPWQILLLTFTNKAAREMLHRVENLTGIPGHKFWGGTFHSIGQRMLRLHGEAVGLSKSYTILDEGDAESLLGTVIRDLDPAFLKNRNNPKPRVVSDLISYARNTQLPLSEVVESRYPFGQDLAPAITRFARVYQERKKAQQVTDYDDLLELWLQLLRADPEVAGRYRERFRHILVDEYQDTNHLQSAIVDELADRHQVMAVGDDAQCIYTWRGANFENIMTFTDRHPGAVIHKIETNYRSSPEILRFANGILDSQPAGHGYSKQLRPVRPSSHRPIALSFVDTRQQAQWICQKVRDLYDDGRSLKDIAILYRAHFHAMDLQMELGRVQIPYTITSGVRFFEQAHIKDVAAQLRFVANPTDLTAWLRFLSLLPKVGPKSAEKLHSQAVAHAAATRQDFFPALRDPALREKVPEPAREDWDSLAHTLHDAWLATRSGPPADAVRVAVEGWYSTWLRQNFPNWMNRQEDLTSLVGFAQRFDSMAELLSQLVLLSSETSDRSIDPDADTLRLTTVHQAKGLEFPVVFIIGLADGLFPLRRAIEADDLDEERRLFYVAVTRAMEELYLSYPLINTSGHGPPTRLDPSRFLREVPTESFQMQRLTSLRGW